MADDSKVTAKKHLHVKRRLERFPQHANQEDEPVRPASVKKAKRATKLLNQATKPKGINKASQAKIKAGHEHLRYQLDNAKVTAKHMKRVYAEIQRQRDARNAYTKSLYLAGRKAWDQRDDRDKFN
jgi:hypothetical protein